MFRSILILTLVSSLLGQLQPVTRAVASTDDPFALRYNPAGLAYHAHTEDLFMLGVDETGLKKDLVYLSQFKTFALGYEWRSAGARNIWELGQGFKLSETQALGFTYAFDHSRWREGRLNLGWMHRPYSVLALGAQVQNIWSELDAPMQLTTGFALQNRSGHIGLNLDLGVLEDNSGSETEYTLSQHFGLFLEPVDGLRVNLGMDVDEDDSRFGLSFSLNVPTVGLESHARSDNWSDQTIILRSSEQLYRSFMDEPPVPKGQVTYVKLRLEGSLMEEPEVKRPRVPLTFDMPIPFLSSPTVYGKQLKRMIDEIDEYTEDETIHGMVIEMGALYGGFSKISELRDAFQRFADADKPIIVYSKFGLNNMTTFLLSMADEIYVHEMAGVDLRGLSMEVIFFRGLLDTLSITPEVWRVSPYKTAGDAFLNDRMSEAMRENYSQLLDGIYKHFVDGIAEGKMWEREHTEEVINKGPYLLTAEAEEAGLITGTMYPDEFDEYVEDLEEGKVNFIKPRRNEDLAEHYTYSWRDEQDSEQIAVIYAVGNIIPGKSQHTPSGSTTMGDETIAKAIKDARENDRVKAIVLRIDSGGGSALASDIMWREVLKTTEADSSNVKPLIASLSDIAASGGYYIACQADSIIAYPSTITGSIGVIGSRLNLSRLQERFGIHTDRLQKGDRADFLTGSRLATEAENEIILASINDTYMRFKERVIRGREDLNDVDALDSIALGRVWTGLDARKNGLIDKVGGYYDAIDLAKKAAGLSGEVEIIEMPFRRQGPDLRKLWMGEDSNRRGLGALGVHDNPVLEALHINDLIPIIQGGELQMVLPVKIEIK